MDIERIPEAGGFLISTKLDEVRLRYFLQAGVDPKGNEWYGPFRFVADWPTVVREGEWLEIDTALRVCHLCFELDGVRVSRTIAGKWVED